MVQRMLLVVIGLTLVAAPVLAQTPIREAAVRSIRVNGTNPVTVTVAGTLPNPCYNLLPPEQSIEGSTITIRLTMRPVGRMCAQVIKPFEETLPVEVTGLAPGQYTLVVNDVNTSFTLTEPGAPAPADAAPTSSAPISPAPAAECLSTAAEQTTYRDDAAGFCLLYPASFEQVPAEAPNSTVFMLGGTGEVRPSLVIVSEPANGRTLDDIAQAQQAAQPDPKITFTGVTVGGQPAIVTEDMQAGSRHAFVIANDRLYTLVAQPVDKSQPIATATTDQLWQMVVESLVFLNSESVKPTATEQRLDDLGIVFALPDGWAIERTSSGYGLIAPDGVAMLTVGGVAYPVSFGALADLPTDDLDTLAAAAVVYYEAQGESRLHTQTVSGVGGQPVGVIVYGLLNACSVTLLPRVGGVTTVTVSSLMCDLDNNITEPAVQAIVESVRVIGE